MADTNVTTNVDPGLNQKGFAGVDDKTHIPYSTDAEGILDRTLGEVLENPQAQQMIIRTMHLSPAKFQQMLDMAKQNNMMQMKMRELFRSDIVQQVIQQQQGSQEDIQAVTDVISSDQTTKPASFLDKLKGFFK